MSDSKQLELLKELVFDRTDENMHKNMVRWRAAAEIERLQSKLDKAEKQIEIMREYATHRLCGDHQGKWERGRCVMCDLERAQSQLSSCRNTLGEAWELLVESVDSATPTDDIDAAHVLEVDIVRATMLRHRIEDLFPEDFK